MTPTLLSNRDALRRFRATNYSVSGDIPYEMVLQRVQKNVSASLPRSVEEISERDLRDAIEKYTMENGVKCSLTDDVTVLSNHIYHDMAGASFISREGLFDLPDFEELNINAWNDVDIMMRDGTRKTDYTFLSPQHAIDIHQRMFQKTKTAFDEAHPSAIADIGSSIRITALRYPLVDADVAVASSVRKVSMSALPPDKLVEYGVLSQTMLDFLLVCLKHGVSVCVSGETGAGKTTLTGALLQILAEKLDIFTIEEGARELSLVRRDESGQVTNRVIHTRTLENKLDPSRNIEQEELVKLSLRFDPDVVVPSEIRGREAFEVMGVANTGHTIITTVHANSTEDTPERIVTLAKKAFAMDDKTLFGMAARAFPILVHCEKLADGTRRVTEIREVTGCMHGEIQSHMLFEYVVEDNITDPDDDDLVINVVGSFQGLNPVSGKLIHRLLKKGTPRRHLEPFWKVDGEDVYA